MNLTKILISMPAEAGGKERTMRTKNIEAVIAKKVKDWLDSIEDQELRNFLEPDVIVTGGCVASMFLGEKVNDYDVYFRTPESARKTAEYYVAVFNESRPRDGLDGLALREIFVEEGKEGRVKIVVKSSGVAAEDSDLEALGEAQGLEPGEYLEKAVDSEVEEKDGDGKRYRPVFVSPNAVTLSNKIQLVFRFWGEPDVIHENYDFVHCTNYWTKKTGLVLRQPALESLLTKDLRYVGSLYPVCSVMRVRKFVRRGWTITAGQLLKMCFQISQLDLSDMVVLEDQLIGVDVAYFMEVVDKLREKNPEKVDGSYLAEILDRMF